MTSHTPGPWRISMRAGEADSRVDSYAIQFGPHGNYIAHVEGNGNASLDNEANARVMATSPELLKCAKNLYELLMKAAERYHQDTDSYREIAYQLSQALIVIRKAEVRP